MVQAHFGEVYIAALIQNGGLSEPFDWLKLLRGLRCRQYLKITCFAGVNQEPGSKVKVNESRSTYLGQRI